MMKQFFIPLIPAHFSSIVLWVKSLFEDKDKMNGATQVSFNENTKNALKHWI